MRTTFQGKELSLGLFKKSWDIDKNYLNDNNKSRRGRASTLRKKDKFREDARGKIARGAA